MIRTFFLPLLVVAAFSFGALTLMATAPVLEPQEPTPVYTTVRIKEVQPEAVQLKVHSQGSVMPSTESQLIPEVTGRVTWMSPKLVAGDTSTRVMCWPKWMLRTTSILGTALKRRWFVPKQNNNTPVLSTSDSRVWPSDA